MPEASAPTLFRQINDAIRDLARRTGSADALPFVCECDNLHCFETVPLSAEDYDTRRDLLTPLVVSSHRAA